MTDLRFSVLASGSTGNATIIANEEVRILVDAGLSGKKIEALLKERDVHGEEIDAILITHEHDDHIKGLGPFARKYKTPIFANEKTWEKMSEQIGKIENEQKKILHTGDKLDFGSIVVESFDISHDAVEPIGFCFNQGEHKLSLATDLGYMSPKVKEKIIDSDVLVLESNHDVQMLRMGRYPWNIKRRILGDTGHLSNEAAGEALCDILSAKTKRIYLAHLSRDHNVMDLAKMTVNQVLEEGGISIKERRISLMDTYYDRPTAWDRLIAD